MLAALRERLGEACDVRARLRREQRRAGGFEEAVEVARQADVAILVMGDKAGLTDDCTSGETRDRASLDLPGVQDELVRRSPRRARRSSSCSSPDGHTAERRSTSGARPSCSPGSPARRAPTRSRTGARSVQPGRQAADLVPARVGADPRLLRATRPRAAARTGRSTTSTSRRRRSTRSATASRTRLRARGASVRRAEACPGRDGDRRRRASATAAPGRATRSSSSTSAIRSRA